MITHKKTPVTYHYVPGLIRIEIKWLSLCITHCHFLLQLYPYSLIQTILSALDSHQIMLAP